MLVRLPDRVATIRVIVAAVALSALCWYFGAGVWEAVMLGCLVTLVAVTVLVGTAPEIRETRWSGSDRGINRGSRSEVSTLSFRLRGGWGRIDLSVQRQARDIARRRLAFYGLDLHNVDHRARIEQLIGPASYGFLVRERRGAPSMRALLACLDALDAIDPMHYAPPEPRQARRFPLRLGPRRARER